MYWTDEDIDAFIAKEYPWFIEQFRGYPYGIQRADAFRYFVLHKYGGVYSDLDIIPKKNFIDFYEMVKSQDVCIARTKTKNAVGIANSLTNSFMLSSPGSEYWPVVWKYLQDPFRKHGWKRIAARFHYFFILFTTGPGIVNDATEEYHETGKFVYRIPVELVQPDDSVVTDGVDTNESVLQHVDGRSWHGKDANFFKAMGTCLNNGFWIVLALMIAFILLFLVFLLLWLSARKQLRRHQIALQPWAIFRS